MADLVHKTVTLQITAKSLATLLDIVPGSSADVPLQSLSLQADGGNAGATFVGGPTVSTTDYGIRIPAAAAGVPSAPERFELLARPVKLSEIYVVGSANEKLHVCGFTW